MVCPGLFIGVSSTHRVSRYRFCASYMAWNQTPNFSRWFSTSPQAKRPPLRSQSSAFPSTATLPGAGRTRMPRFSVSVANSHALPHSEANKAIVRAVLFMVIVS